MDEVIELWRQYNIHIFHSKRELIVDKPAKTAIGLDS